MPVIKTIWISLLSKKRIWEHPPCVKGWMEFLQGMRFTSLTCSDQGQFTTSSLLEKKSAVFKTVYLAVLLYNSLSNVNDLHILQSNLFSSATLAPWLARSKTDLNVCWPHPMGTLFFFFFKKKTVCNKHKSVLTFLVCSHFLLYNHDADIMWVYWF